MPGRFVRQEGSLACQEQAIGFLEKRVSLGFASAYL